MKISKLGTSFILGSIISLSSFPFMNQTAHANLNCPGFESFGKRNKSEMFERMSDFIEGKSFRLQFGRKLRINQLKAIDFDLCRLKMDTTATLKRPLGKDRKGVVQLEGKVTFFRLNQKFCLKPVKATNVKLHKVGKQMEASIKGQVDTGFKSQCFSI